MPSLKDRLNDAVKSALKSRAKERLAALRLITAAIKQREVDERITLDDTAVITVLDKMTKQRRESIDHYERAKRQDLIDQENYELSVIREFMPQPLDDAEIDAAITQALTETGANSIKDMGKVMAALKPSLQGRADMGQVSARVKQRLSS